MGGLTPIPWTAIVSYVDRHDLDDSLVEIIMLADEMLLSHINGKAQKQVAASGDTDGHQGSKAQA